MAALEGTPSDEAPAILATGRSDVTTLYTSFSARSPLGEDAAYNQWHTLDHRPEQQRLSELRTSCRLVSTPACRAERAVSHERFDETDHITTYFFRDLGAMESFYALSMALEEAGRNPPPLPTVERGVYSVSGRAAAARVKAGADVLPWWPAKGIYLVIERGETSAAALSDVEGVGGVWWAAGEPMDPPLATGDNAGLQLSFCFLDEDPPAVARSLRPVLERRWEATGVEPLLAAPFYAVVPYAWDRYLP
jgi:hypothetical protein